MGVQKRYLDIEQLGAVVVAVSADKPESLATLRDKKRISYPIVHTPGGEAFKKLEVYKKEAFMNPVPVPGLMIFDRTFVLRYTELRDSLIFRVGAKSLLRELPKLAFELVPKG